MIIDVKNLDKEVERIKKTSNEELAKYLHDNYEFFSKEEGWETQKDCRVEFDDLPEKNKLVMVKVANTITTGFFVPLIMRISELEADL